MSHLAALMLECCSRVSYLLEGLFLFRSSLQGVLTGPCCGFKQRRGNFRETQYPGPAEFGNPKELTNFLLDVQTRY